MQKDDQERLNKPPVLGIKTRLSACLVFSGLYRWRELQLKARNIQSKFHSTHDEIGLIPLSGNPDEPNAAQIDSEVQNNDDQDTGWALFDDYDFLWNFDDTMDQHEDKTL